MMVKDRNMALVTAVADKNALAVAVLLKEGADIHYNDDFALRCAVYLGNVEIVDILLKNKANVHANGDEPLFTAIKARDYTLIDKLLENGASIQAVLDARKDRLDKESLDLIGGLRTRDSHTASEKRMTDLKEKARKIPRPVMKMRGP